MLDKFSGYQDGIRENIIYGWAQDKTGPCFLDLFVDGVFISKTMATKLRTDLIGIVSSDGKCGFLVEIPVKFCDGRERLVELFFSGTKKHVNNGKTVFAYKLEFKAPVIITKADPAIAGNAKRLLSLLKPKDVVGGRLIRVGNLNDGGYVMLDRGIDGCVAYSIGINDDVGWDLAMAERGAHIYQYDHTIDCLPVEHPQFHWEKLGVAGAPSGDGFLKTIPELLARNGHLDQHQMILKMDVEGYEWEVLNNIPASILNAFSQIILELHNFERLDEPAFFTKIESALQILNRDHQLIHVHSNNYGWYMIAGGVPMPATFEATYVRKADLQFHECRKAFPTELDTPCNQGAADYYLGYIGLTPEA